MTKFKYNPAPLADPKLQELFKQEAPNALADDFIYSQSGDDSEFVIVAQQIEHHTGLKNGNTPVSTKIWGYGEKDKGDVTWPGKTFVVQSNQKTKVKWLNELTEDDGSSVPHLLPLDETLHWCYSLQDKKRTILGDGIPLVPHLHGGHNSPEADGNPEYFKGLTENSEGPRFVSEEYEYDNSQRAGTLWYHDHALGITRLNVYAGLAGFYIIRDQYDTGEEDNIFGLPAKPYELAYCVQDRMFLKSGELFLPAYRPDAAWGEYIDSTVELPEAVVDGPSAMAEFFGDHIVVNGKLWPKANVEPRNYRVRLLNGCDSRFMRIQLRAVKIDADDFTEASEPLPFTIVGSDQGLLKQSVEVTCLDFMPGERLDIVIDFSKVDFNSRIIVENILGDGPFTGEIDPPTDRRTDRIMAFDINQELNSQIAEYRNDSTAVVEDRFDSVAFGTAIYDRYPNISDTINSYRKLGLYEGKDKYGRLMPMLGTATPVRNVKGLAVNGSMVWDAEITETPVVGDTEIWDIYNATGDAHPIHVHLVHFEIMSRQKFNLDTPGVKVQQEVRTHSGTGIGFRLENLEIIPVDANPVLPSENGPKDMVICYPGEVTRIKMTFDRVGRYVWHCHILSHEDHEMMRAITVIEAPED